MFMRVGRLLALPVLAFVLTGGLSGCSAPSYPTAVDVFADGDQLVLVGDYTFPYGLSGSPFQAATTNDGVHTVDVPGHPRIDRAAGSGRLTCLDGEPRHCFRPVAGHLAVEESTDGVTWRQVWAVPDSRRAYLARQCDYCGSVSANLATVALAAVRGPDGVIVAAANGRDGFALRDGAGRWQRIGFPPEAPGLLKSPGQYIFYEYGTAVLVVAALLLAGFVAGRRDRGPRTAWWWALLLIPVAGWALVQRFTHGTDPSPPLPEVMSVLVIAAIAAPVLMVGVVLAIQRRSRWLSGVAILAVPILAGAAVAYTFYGWSAGRPAQYGHAVLIAFAVVGAAAGAVLLLGRRLASAPPIVDKNVPAPGVTFADVPPADPALLG
jgi:hypothetical protein